MNTTLLKIGGVKVSPIEEYEIEYAKLWKDADRNMNGDVRATLIGVFPKIKVKTRAMNSVKSNAIKEVLNRAYFSVEYTDMNTRSVRVANFYASDVSIKLYDKGREIVEGFSFNLIPISKM